MSSSTDQQPMASLESNLANMSIKDSDEPTVSEENSEHPVISPEDSAQATSSTDESNEETESPEDSNHHNATALCLITDLHSFLATATNDPPSQALVATKMVLLTKTYHRSASYVFDHKSSLGGTWLPDNTLPPPPPSLFNTRTSKQYNKVTTAFIAAAADYSKHSRFVEAMGRDVIAVPPGENQLWERHLLAWRVMREKSDLKFLDDKCERLKKRMLVLRLKRAAERRDAGNDELFKRADPVLKEFLKVHMKMEEAERMVKLFLGKGLKGKGKGKEGAKGKDSGKMLEKWRVWPDGSGSVVECLVHHVHGGQA